MGRIKTKLVKGIAKKLIKEHGSEFTSEFDKNKAFVLMSGTIHSESALRDIFGINDFEVVDAEIKNQGEIIVKELGMEKDCSYRNLKNGIVSREWYLKALNRIVSESVKPALIHVNAFDDLEIDDRLEAKPLTLRERVGIAEGF